MSWKDVRTRLVIGAALGIVFDLGGDALAHKAKQWIPKLDAFAAEADSELTDLSARIAKHARYGDIEGLKKLQRLLYRKGLAETGQAAAAAGLLGSYLVQELEETGILAFTEKLAEYLVTPTSSES